MKKRDLYRLRQKLAAVAPHVRGPRTGYALVRSLKKLEEELVGLEAARRPIQGFQEFEQQRIALCVKHAAKDEKGAPRMLSQPNGGSEYDIVDRPAFEAQVQELRSKHADALAAQEILDKALQSTLEADADFQPHRVKYSVYEAEQRELAPSDRLSAEKLAQIWDLLEDDGEAADTATLQEKLMVIRPPE